MKFSGKEDIEKPIEQVFSQLSNFEMFERTAIRRGAEIERVSDVPVLMVGMAWKVKFEMRGRMRKVKVSLIAFDTPNSMTFQAEGQSFDGTLNVDLLALSPRRTRLTVTAEIKPKTLSARLLVQSMRLAKKNLNRRFRDRLSAFVTSL